MYLPNDKDRERQRDASLVRMDMAKHPSVFVIF